MRRAVLLLGAIAAVWLPAVPAAAQSDADRKVIEAGQKEGVKRIKPTLPQKIDDFTTLVDVVASGVILTYTFSVDTTKFKMMPDFIERVRKNSTSTACKNDSMVKVMKMGAIYRYTYFDPKSQPLGQFDVKSTDCG